VFDIAVLTALQPALQHDVPTLMPVSTFVSTAFTFVASYDEVLTDNFSKTSSSLKQKQQE